MAYQTVQHGASVSVVVIAAAEAAVRPGLMQKWVTDIRGRLRGSDLVGTLTESEIAVLLSEATAADAAAVVERIRGDLGATESWRHSAAVIDWHCHPLGGIPIRPIRRHGGARRRQARVRVT